MIHPTFSITKSSLLLLTIFHPSRAISKFLKLLVKSRIYTTRPLTFPGFSQAITSAGGIKLHEAVSSLKDRILRVYFIRWDKDREYIPSFHGLNFSFASSPFLQFQATKGQPTIYGLYKINRPNDESINGC